MVMGVAYGLNLIGLLAVDPYNTVWQFNQHDPSTHFIGWEFFRHEPWSLPLGKIRSYLYPEGTSVVFTDSIPLAAIVLKLFNPILPSSFQYFGIWRLVSYALQGLFGYLLLARVTKYEWTALAGSVLFIIAPIFNSRIDHAALQSHWLILCALYLYLKNDSLKTRLQWGGLLVGSALIHFYLFAMVFTIWFAYLLREGFSKTIPERRQLLLVILGTLTILALSMWGVGYFVSGMDVSPPPHTAGSFGQRSMNLNAPFNPGYGISGLYMPKLPTLSKEQWNGYCYLGVGGLLLLALAVNATPLWTFRLELKKHLPIFALSVMLICFAISNIISFGERVLFEVPLPDWMLQKLNLFRASGRFIWPVNYALLLGGCAAIAQRYSRQTTFTLLCLLVAIQVIDLWPQHWRRSKLFENRPNYCASPLTSPLWGEFAKKYRHIAFIPPRFDWLDDQCDDYVHFARLAVANGMTLNVAYLARHDGRNGYSDLLATQFTNGTLAPDTLYILKDWAKKSAYATRNYPFIQGNLDSFILIAPNTSKEDLGFK